MSEKFIATKVKDLKPSGIRLFFDLVMGAKDVVSLGVGEPDFSTPWKISSKAVDKIEQGYTSYTSNRGLPELRREIAKFLENERGVSYDPDTEILVTVGASQGIDLAFRTLLNPGERAIIVKPAYVAYEADIILAGGEPVCYVTDAESGFKVEPGVLRALIKKSGAKLFLLNYPCNPTGATYTKKELQAIWNVCKDEGVLVLSDEIYDMLSYDVDHVAFPTLKGAKAQTLYFNGFSKAFAMTGWRMGYVCGPKEIIAAMTKIFGYTMLSAPIMGQYAACAALHALDEAKKMTAEYHLRRNYIVAALNEIGLHVHCPQGAFYAFPSVASTGLNGYDFAMELFKTEKVAVVPGTAFGEEYKDFVRISYASPFDDLKEAVRRMKLFMDKRK